MDFAQGEIRRQNFGAMVFYLTPHLAFSGKMPNHDFADFGIFILFAIKQRLHSMCFLAPERLLPSARKW
jgi:hypothetical protein